MSTSREEVDFYLPLHDEETGLVDPEAWFERGLRAAGRDLGLGVSDAVAGDIIGALPQLEGVSVDELPEDIRADLRALARLIEQENDEDPATTEAIEQALQAITPKIETL